MEPSAGMAATLLTVGALVVLAVAVKACLRRLGVPALVGFLVLGFLVRVLAGQTGVPGAGGREVLHFLGKLGVIALLFRVGLESDLAGLLRQLRSASVIWLGSVGLAGALGFWAARELLELATVPSLVIGVAMTATSVGIPTLVWREHAALRTAGGERFLDVAELDDISGVIFLALLFAVLPAVGGAGLVGGGPRAVAAFLVRQAGLFALKLAALVAGAWAFSRWLEAPLSRLVRRLVPAPDPMLVILGLGVMLAAVAGQLGFSVAIGAFLAGLVFSRDEQAAQVQRSFRPLYELLTPFFFVSVGLMLAPAALPTAAGGGAVLLTAAVVGKVVGTGLPALAFGSARDAAILGVSMVPRAEITMLVVQKAHAAGDAVLGQTAYAGMVVVCAATCILGPLALRWLLARRPGGAPSR